MLEFATNVSLNLNLRIIPLTDTIWPFCFALATPRLDGAEPENFFVRFIDTLARAAVNPQPEISPQ
jgi:hypothetical protein